jgi:PAS domain S-box-containing protein
MSKSARSLFHYAWAVLAVAAAMLLRWCAWPVLRSELAFLFFWPVLMFCAWMGGLGPGVAATLLSALAADFFFLEPRFSLAVARPADVAGLAAFTVSGCGVSALAEMFHRARRQAELQRERWRVTLASVGDAIIATDTDGCITFLNGVAESLTGWSGDEAKGKALAEVFRIFNEQTREPIESPVEKVLSTGHAASLANHTILVSRNGEEIAIADSAGPIRDDDDSLLGVVLVFRDVTKARDGEQQLREQTRRLREADLLKDRFLGTLAHELRGPLAPLLNAVTILHVKYGQDRELQTVTQIIERQVAHLTRLVEDLLDVSRAATGKVKLHQERVEAATIVVRAVEMCRPLVERKRQELSVSLPERPIYMHADATRITQVLHNLLANASKFTGEGGRIVLSAAIENQDVVIRVVDNGVGIAEALLPHVFDWLKQGAASLPAETGLGIGLSLVKSLVDLHDGTVEARSGGLGKGSEFVVRLPAAPD